MVLHEKKLKDNYFISSLISHIRRGFIGARIGDGPDEYPAFGVGHDADDRNAGRDSRSAGLHDWLPTILFNTLWRPNLLKLYTFPKSGYLYRGWLDASGFGLLEWL